MPSEFTIDIKLDVSVPNWIDADIPMRQIAEKVVMDSRRNIREQTQPEGSRYESLSEKTIKDKIREHAPYPTRALYRKGVMYRAVHAYHTGKNQYIVGVIPRGRPRRDEVAMAHHGEWYGIQWQLPGLPIRKFLAMSQKTRDWANARISRWIKQNIKEAARKYINFKY